MKRGLALLLVLLVLVRLALPALERDHLNHHHYVAAAFKAHYGGNPGGGCGAKGPGLNSIHEPLLFKSGSKENVQETQI